MKLAEQRELSRLNKEIKEAQAQLAAAFEALHRLHHERGALLYKPIPGAAESRSGTDG